MKHNRRIFRDSQVLIEGNSIQCENYICFLSSISQAWIEKLPKSGWLENSEETGLNLELNSGSSYFFVSGSEEFLHEAFLMIRGLVLAGKAEEKVIWNLAEGTIVKEERKKAVIASKAAAFPTDQMGAARRELYKLAEYFKGKDNQNEQIMEVLGDIAEHMDTGETEGVRELYQRFIGFSLVNECNEMGCSSLLEEIKSKIYQG